MKLARWVQSIFTDSIASLTLLHCLADAGHKNDYLPTENHPKAVVCPQVQQVAGPTSSPPAKANCSRSLWVFLVGGTL